MTGPAPFQFNDDEWREIINRQAKLPDSARELIAETVSFYKCFCDTEKGEPRPHDVKDELAGLAKKAAVLVEAIDKLSNRARRELMGSIPASESGSPLFALALLSERRAQAGALVDWAQTAAATLNRKSPGADSRNLGWFICRLVSLYKKQSNRRFEDLQAKDFNFIFGTMKVARIKAGSDRTIKKEIRACLVKLGQEISAGKFPN